MKKTIQFSAYQYFSADIFAEDRKEWEPHAKNVALRFLLKYNENSNYILDKLESFAKSRDSLTLNEVNQLKVISNLTSLYELLKFNNIAKDVDIDYQKIDAIFFEIKNQEEIAEITKAINTLENDKTTSEINSFGELSVWFNFLVSFVKNRDFRRSFYLDFLIQKDVDIPQTETKSLFLNRSML